MSNNRKRKLRNLTRNVITGVVSAMSISNAGISATDSTMTTDTVDQPYTAERESSAAKWAPLAVGAGGTLATLFAGYKYHNANLENAQANLKELQRKNNYDMNHQELEDKRNELKHKVEKIENRNGPSREALGNFLNAMKHGNTLQKYKYDMDINTLVDKVLDANNKWLDKLIVDVGTNANPVAALEVLQSKLKEVFATSDNRSLLAEKLTEFWNANCNSQTFKYCTCIHAHHAAYAPETEMPDCAGGGAGHEAHIKIGTNDQFADMPELTDEVLKMLPDAIRTVLGRPINVKMAVASNLNTKTTLTAANLKVGATRCEEGITSDNNIGDYHINKVGLENLWKGLDMNDGANYVGTPARGSSFNGWTTNDAPTSAAKLGAMALLNSSADQLFAVGARDCLLGITISTKVIANGDDQNTHPTINLLQVAAGEQETPEQNATRKKNVTQLLAAYKKAVTNGQGENKTRTIQAETLALKR